jgi:hypothetical protein
MRRCSLLLLALALIALACAGVTTTSASALATMFGLNIDSVRGGSGLAVSVASKCITVGDKRICLEDDDNPKNNDNEDVNDDKPKKKKTSNICAGDVSCPAGYVVLDKPNKYGACCEPKEGFPDKPAPAAEKCKFGMVGTPPNCECPFGSVFSGYKGCLKTCCGTPSTDPKYTKVYVQCNADAAKARSNAVALAKANGDPGTNVTCELTSSFPPQPD